MLDTLSGNMKKKTASSGVNLHYYFVHNFEDKSISATDDTGLNFLVKRYLLILLKVTHSSRRELFL